MAMSPSLFVALMSAYRDIFMSFNRYLPVSEVVEALGALIGFFLHTYGLAKENLCAAGAILGVSSFFFGAIILSIIYKAKQSGKGSFLTKGSVFILFKQRNRTYRELLPS